jgi:NADH dehydrogenase [ubiquinone] 1 alpha subcomplex assembly factor 7
MRCVLIFVGANAFGPITQKDFLLQMGIQQRLLDLLKLSKSLSVKKDLTRACDRLVNPDEMGNIYKFFAIGNSDSIYGFP